MRRLLARADQLQPRDYLPATQRTVAFVNHASASSTVVVTLLNKEGIARMFAWGKSTEIRIDRPE